MTKNTCKNILLKWLKTGILCKDEFHVRLWFQQTGQLRRDVQFLWYCAFRAETVECGGVTAAEVMGIVFLVGLGTRGGCSEGNIYRTTGFPGNASKLTGAASFADWLLGGFLQLYVNHVLSILVLCGVHAREGGCHATEKLLHVVACFRTSLNKHYI